MDLNRLRVLAGLDEIVEQDLSSLNEAEKIKKGAFHKWLGKPEDEKITQADIDRGLASDDEHVRKMAQFAKNMTEAFETQDSTYFVYGKCERTSAKISALNMFEAVKTFSKTKIQKLSGNPVLSSPSNPVKFIDEEGKGCEYVSYQLTDESEDITNYTNALIESDNALSKQGKGSNPSKTPNHDSDIPKVMFMNNTKPANTLEMSTVEFNDDTMAANKIMKGVDVEEASKIKVPADVMKHINKRLKELKDAVETYDEKGYDDKSTKALAIECLEKIKKHLEAGNQEEYRMAQVYYGTLMSPIFDMFPTQLINFLHSKKDSKKLTDKI